MQHLTQYFLGVYIFIFEPNINIVDPSTLDLKREPTHVMPHIHMQLSIYLSISISFSFFWLGHQWKSKVEGTTSRSFPKKTHKRRITLNPKTKEKHAKCIDKRSLKNKPTHIRNSPHIRTFKEIDVAKKEIRSL